MFAVREANRLAAAWIAARNTHQPAELQQLLDAGAQYLQVAVAGISHTRAREAIVTAWSQQAAEKSRVYVDLDASSPQLLVLVDEVTKTRRLFPVADLARILGPRIAAA